MTDLSNVVRMLIHQLDTTRPYLLPSYCDEDEKARAVIAFAESALAAEPAFAASEPSDEDLADLSEVFNGDPLPAMRRALELWGRPTIAALAAEPPAPAEPDTDVVLVLAAIIRQVAEGGMPGAARLAELILSHPNIASVFQPPAPAPAADGAARLRQCPTHGQQPANAWACPECLRELREELARLKAPAADGEREELAQWLEGEAEYYESLSTEASAKATRAAALLRQLPPEGVEAIRYCVEEDGAVIQRTSRAPESWAIRAGSSCMSTTGEWDIEPMPSERTDEWLANHRWPSAAAAWAALQQARQQEVGDD